MTPSDATSSSRWRIMWDKAGWVLFMFAVSRLLIVALTVFSRQIVQRGPYVVVSTQEDRKSVV